jgi:1,4-dihydroxy-2-naphthoate octaprenyltransferase
MSTPEALWHLARPRMWPYVMMLVGAGYGWAHWDRALDARGLEHVPVVMLAWTLLHAGTLWINSAVDRDEGEVLLGRAVPPPRGTMQYGYAALVGTVLLGSLAGVTVGVVAALCATLSVLYSHPRFFWKGDALGGPAVNLIGYGLASPMVGFVIVGVPATPRTLVVWPLMGLAVLGMFFAAQAFQGEEDRQRGYHTLVATHGSAVVISAARWCINVSVAGGVVLALIGWLPRSCLVCVPGWWVLDRWLVAWAREPNGGTEAWARGFTKRLLWVGLLGLFAALGDYVWDSWQNRPVAGLGTEAGHPPDRPLLPPGQMRLWERSVGGVIQETLP